MLFLLFAFSLGLLLGASAALGWFKLTRETGHFDPIGLTTDRKIKILFSREKLLLQVIVKLMWQTMHKVTFRCNKNVKKVDKRKF